MDFILIILSLGQPMNFSASLGDKKSQIVVTLLNFSSVKYEFGLKTCRIIKIFQKDWKFKKKITDNLWNLSVQSNLIISPPP